MDNANQKGQWASRFGFLMAAIGSAIGLGNIWGFPYKMGKGGGFAFLLIYLVLVATVGIIIMLAELSLGRKTGKGVIAAYSAVSKKYTIVGVISWLSPLLILGFYCMLGGYTVKYAIANLGDLFGASWGVGSMSGADLFSTFSSNQVESVIYTLLFVFMTVFIVRKGVSSGIEKFTTVAMPALFVMLIIVIVRAVTLPGASAGLAFVYKPNFEVFHGSGWVNVLGSAGSQMFFSLSLGMAIMVTYGSYMKKEEDLQQNAVIIPLADTLAAVMAATAVMPTVAAFDLDYGAGPGLLFITLQEVFSSMGATGPFFGFLFYALVFTAAITSSISLTEAVSSVIMDKQIEKGKPVNRNRVTLGVGIVIAIEGSLVALDGLGSNGFPKFLGQGTLLDAFDLISEGIFMPLAAFATAIIFGWFNRGWLDDEITDLGEGGKAPFRMKRYFYFCLSVIAPVIMLLVLVGQIDSFFPHAHLLDSIVGIFG